MKKIPSVFLRDPEDMSRLTHEVNPLAQWVIDGEGVPTRKYDGTCVMLDEDGQWWARREVKPGKIPPPNWVEVDVDLITEKRMGWEPIEQSGYRKQLEEALSGLDENALFCPGTYELCGPKVGVNSEGYPVHVLVSHAYADRITMFVADRTNEAYDNFKIFLLFVDLTYGWEGIVWHHPDGRMAKLKVRDFKK